nr:immunoglobulin light chain junction region [Macaca mulatta]
CLQFYSDPWTF